MKKKCYGLYVLFLGLQLKTFRKKDLSFQMKFVQAATKYLSMVLIITAFAVACTTPGGGIPIISDDEDKEEEVKGNWKSGLTIETTNDVIISNSSSKDEDGNKIEKEVVDEDGNKIIIKEVELANSSFEEPKASEKTLVVTGEQLSSWIIEKGDVTIIKGEGIPEGVQAVSINGKGPAKITQKVKTVLGRNYLLSIYALAGASCTPPQDKLGIHWNSEERTVIDLQKSWQLFEITLESSQVDNALSFETKSTSGCGSGIDNIRLTYEDDGKGPASVLIDETDSIESLKLELQNLLNDLRNDPLTPLTPIPTITPTAVVPTPTPTPISVLPEPTPTPQPEVTLTPTVTIVPTLTPTSKYDTSSSIETELEDMVYTNGPTVFTDNVVAFTATVGSKIEPNSIQIWSLSGDSGAILSDATYDPNICSTEKPSVFFRKPLDVGYSYTNTNTKINWAYCVNGITANSELTVPYQTATTWTWNAETGVLIFEGNKAIGAGLEWGSSPGINAYVIVVIGPNGLMSRKIEVR